MSCFFTRAQRSHRVRNVWRGVAREWCGRTSDRRERGATVARRAGPRRAAPYHSEARPERSVSGVEGPAGGGVGAASTCGKIGDHVGVAVSLHLHGPLRRSSPARRSRSMLGPSCQSPRTKRPVIRLPARPPPTRPRRRRGRAPSHGSARRTSKPASSRRAGRVPRCRFRPRGCGARDRRGRVRVLGRG